MAELYDVSRVEYAEDRVYCYPILVGGTKEQATAIMFECVNSDTDLHLSVSDTKTELDTTPDE